MITIIGAGPAGSYLAYLLAKNKEQVQIFEEHSKVGKPIQCAGIISNLITELIEIKPEFIINKITTGIIKTRTHSLEVPLKENFVLDREKFDNYLLSIAIKEGAKFYLNHKFISYKKKLNSKKLVLYFENNKIYETDLLVGADGPLSQVAKCSGLFGIRHFLHGVQAKVKGYFNSNAFEIYLGVGDFAWSIPESNKISRIGLVSGKNANKLFKEFSKGKKIIDYQSGLIPSYDPELRIQKDNVYLIGDAATQVKSTTYGGIVYGLMAAQEFVKDRKNYQKNCKKRFGKELRISLILRNIMYGFKEKDYDKLIEIMNKKSNKILLSEFNRDTPSKFIFKLIRTEPRLLQFLPKLLF